jgi:two-component system, sensor histidine kinase PdtaS
MAYAQHSLGKTHATLDNHDSARYYIQASIASSKEMGYNDLTRDNYYILSELEEKEDNVGQALEYYKIAAAVNDSIFNKEKIAKFTELQIRYNMEKQERENELLRQKNEIQSLQIKRDRILRYSLLGGGLFILIILVLIFFQGHILRRTNKALEKQNREILKMDEEKEKLICQLEKENEERRIAEKKIVSLLEEKEMLIKEVHHRIKNNMNMMKSLLSLQARTIKDPVGREVLKDAVSRFQSMGVLYDKIYRSLNVKALSTHQYIPPLIDEIISVFPNRAGITVHEDIENFVLPVKTLTPLGIILTELITNAMKYGFSGIEKGILNVRFYCKNGKAVCEVKNNGKPLPKDFSAEKSTGFGLRLVNMLVQQLNGTFHADMKGETAFIITFPLS